MERVNRIGLLAATLCCLLLAACPEPAPSNADAAAAGADVESPTPDTGGAAAADTGPSAPDAGPGAPDGSVAPVPDGSVAPVPDGSVTPAPDGSVTPTPDGSVAPTPDGGVPTEILGYPVSPQFGSVIFNEVLMDGTTEGDPNGDGDANQVEDQFVELVNASAAAVAMDGFTLVNLKLPDLPRHTFSTFSLGAGHAVVVFGGGDAPDPTATTTFFTANAEDPGLQFGLYLSLDADSVLLLDAAGKVVAYFCYGGTAECPLAAASDESLTRSPDVTGDFAPHRAAAGSNGAAFSVGTKVDGSEF